MAAVAQTPASLTEICERIVALTLARDAQGAEFLYTSFARGLRILATKHCPEYAEDCVQETVLMVCKQIQQGQLKVPAALPGYLQVVLKRVAWNKKLECEKRGANSDVFDTVVNTAPDERANPERLLEIKERVQILRQALRSLKPQEQEILVRFYLKNQTQEFICREMQLTETQFRLHKSRSKQKLEAFTKKRLRRPLCPFGAQPKEMTA